ncbi:MAG: substrate-binding periplasmic protein [Pseudomonadota bacterium]
MVLPRIIIVLLLMLGCVEALAACERTLKVAASGVWGAQREQQLTESAIDQEWLRAIADSAGFCLQAESRETLIARRLALLESGVVDVLVGASRTPDRERYAWFSRPYRDERVLLFVRAEQRKQFQHVRQFADLQQLPLPWLAVRDSWLGPGYANARQQLLKNQRVFEFDAYPQGLAMLRYGRGHLLLAPDAFAHFLKQEAVSDIVSLPTVIHREPVFFMLSKASVTTDELARFDNALLQVQKQRGLR